MTGTGEPQMERIVAHRGRVRVYDITVARPFSNFVADDILVHNKSPARPPLPPTCTKICYLQDTESACSSRADCTTAAQRV